MDGAGNVRVVVGVDGAGRTHRLDQLAAASSLRVLRVNPPLLDSDRLVADLAAAPDALVLVDDAHRLTPAEAASLAAAARRGQRIVLARRPTLPSREHADLDEALGGQVEQLAPLDVTALRQLAAASWGRPVPDDLAVALRTASGGLPGIAVLLAPDEPAGVAPGPGLAGRIQRRMAMLAAPVATVARILALRLDLPDTALAEASTMDGAAVDVAAAMRELAEEGWLIPGAETMVPAIAAAVLAELPAAQRRRVHEAVARALANVGADAVVAATQLRAARAYVPASAAVFAAAGDQVRLTDPGAAIGWYDDAIEAGADPQAVALGRAEASALLGLPVEPPAAAQPELTERAATLAGVVEAQQGRTDRAAAALVGAGPVGALLATPSCVAVGDLAAARTGSAAAGATWMKRLAEATLTAAEDPARAVPALIEAVEAFDRMPPQTPLPDTPHAVGALLASCAGDTASAELMLDRGLAAGSGGPVYLARHRLLLAWVRMRAGRYDTAVSWLEGDQSGLTGRDRVLAAALKAGIARRSGDVAALRDAWTAVEPALARRAFDLFTAEAVEELAAAATRLRQHARVAPAVEALDEIVTRLGGPAPWRVSVGWIRVQVAIAAEDAAAAAAAAATIEDACRHSSAARHRALCAASALWASVLAGDADPDAAVTVATELAAVDLPWEGSRLVGQAAIRTADPAAARRLLERARDLSSAEVTTERGRADSGVGGLSEREVEVARMALAGGTYREIGARLFISPKTVEHHVARIRTKVGANSRAEFVAALRQLLGPDPG